jgi:lysozyme family protein
MMIVACPRCGSIKIKIIWPEHFGNLYECEKCGKTIEEKFDEKESDMDTNWDKAIGFVLRMEGGYTLDSNDPGGETIFGIARNRNASWQGWSIVDAKRNDQGFPASLENDPDLKASAIEFYKQNFWNAISGDDLPTPLAISVFDCAVNQGVSKARHLLQIALEVEVDGVIGTKTIAAASRADTYRIKKFLTERLSAYARTMVENPKLLVFANNWSYRVLSLAQIVL